MSLKLKVPAFLLPPSYGSGQSYEVVEVEGRTVGECIEQLETKFPGLKQKLRDEKGQLNPFYEVFVNSESSYPEELAKAVKDGDELMITVVFAGG